MEALQALYSTDTATLLQEYLTEYTDSSLGLFLSSADTHNAQSPQMDRELADICLAMIADAKNEPSDRTDTFGASLASFFIETDMAMRSSEAAGNYVQNIPLHIQKELALLWRTVSIMRFSASQGVMQTFFKQILASIREFPPLSLSAYWMVEHGSIVPRCEIENRARAKLDEESSSETKINSDASNNNSHSSESIVGIPDSFDRGIKNSPNNAKTRKEGASVHAPDKLKPNQPARAPILDLPELKYLDGFTGDPSKLDVRHDPLGIVQKLLDTAESCVFATQPSERGTLLSVCLSLAAKSGRSSLLCQVATLLLSEDGDQYRDVDISALNEIALGLSAAVGGPKSAQSATSAGNHINSILQKRGIKTGVLLSFGKSDHGKLGHGDTQLHRMVPTVVDGLRHIPFIKMASMSTCALAVDRSGAVYIWGTGCTTRNSASPKPDLRPVRLENINSKHFVTNVSCGLGHALFLVKPGGVYSWGNGGNGRLGLGDVNDRAEACRVLALAPFSISVVQCGASHSLALTASGGVYCWGKNTQGQIGLGHMDENVLLPSIVNAFEVMQAKVIEIGAGWEHSAALTTDGKVYTWGCGYKDSRRGVIPPVLGLGHNEGRSSPHLVSTLVGMCISRITCGWDHCLALSDEGRVLSWGSGQNGKLGHGTEENVAVPTYIQKLEGVRIIYISAGCEHSAAISDKGVLFTWGHGDGGRLGHGDNNQCFTPCAVSSLEMLNACTLDVHCGDKFTMVLMHNTLDLPLVANEMVSAEENVKEFNETWLHQQCDNRLSPTISTNQIDSPHLPTRWQVGECLLSLLARSCEDKHIAKRLCVDPSDRAYSIECSPSTFGYLLTLLDMHADIFCAGLSGVACNNEEDKDRIMAEDEEPNLEDSVDSLKLIQPGPKCRTSTDAVTANIYVGTCDSNQSLRVSCGPLMHTLTLIRANLDVLEVQMEQIRRHELQAPNSGRGLNEKLPAGAPQESLGYESEDDNGSIASTNSESHIGLLQEAEEELGMRDLASLVEFLKLQDEGGEHEQEGQIESFDQQNTQIPHIHENLMEQQQQISALELSTRDSIAVVLGNSASAMMNGPSRDSDHPQDVSIRESLEVNELVVQSNGIQTNGIASNIVNPRVNITPVLSREPPGGFENDVIDGEMTPPLDNLSVAGDANDIYEAGLEAQRSKDICEMSIDASLLDESRRTFEESMTQELLSEAVAAAKAGNIGREDGKNDLLLPDKNTGPVAEIEDSLGGSMAGSVETFTADSDTDSDSDLEDLVADRDLQKAILSSMEMPSSGKDENLVMRRLKNCVNEVQLTLPRIAHLIDLLSRECYRNLNAEKNTLSQQNAAAATWFKLQEVISTSHSVLCSREQQQNMLHQLLRDPADIMYCVPGVIDNLLKEHGDGGSRLADMCSFVSEGIDASDAAEKVTMRDITTLLRHIKEGTFSGSGLVDACQLFIRSKINKLVRALLSLSATYLTEKKILLESNLMLTILVENVSAELKTILAKSKVTLINIGELEESFTGLILPFVCSLLSSKPSMECAILHHPHTLHILEIFRGILNDCSSENDLFVDWLTSKMRWIMLPTVATLKMLLKPLRNMQEYSIRLQYYQLSDVLDVRQILSEYDCTQLDNGGQLLDGPQMQWLRLIRSVNGDHVVHNTSSNTLSSILVEEKSCFLKQCFRHADALIATEVASIDYLGSPESWRKFAVAGGDLRPVLSTAVLTSLFPEFGTNRNKHCTLTQSSDSLLLSNFKDDVENPRSDVDYAHRLRLLLFGIILKANMLHTAIDALSMEKDPLAAFKTDSDRCLYMAAWVTSLCICLCILNIVETESMLTRRDTLAYIIDRCVYILGKPLAPFSSFILEPKHFYLKSDPKVRAATFDASIIALLHDLSEANFTDLSMLSNPSSLYDSLLGRCITGVKKPFPANTALIFILIERTPIIGIERHILREHLCFNSTTVAVALASKLFRLLAWSPNSQLYLSKCLLQIKENSWKDRAARTTILAHSPSRQFARLSSALQESIDTLDEEFALQIRAIPSARDSKNTSDEKVKFNLIPFFLETLQTIFVAAHVSIDRNIRSINAITSHVLEIPYRSFTAAIAKIIDCMEGIEEPTTSDIQRLQLCFSKLNILIPRTAELAKGGIYRRLTAFYMQILPIACKSLEMLSSYTSDRFDRTHVFSSALLNQEASFLSPVITSLESASPGLVSNVFTPTGDYTLGFWLWIPNSLTVGHHEDKVIHILSRVPETGDFNVVSLLNGLSSACDCNPSISLHISGNQATIVVAATIHDVTNDSIIFGVPHAKNIRRINLTSDALHTDKWLHCAVSAHTTPASKSPPTETEKETTAMALFVNGKEVQRIKTPGSRSPLHQNLITGMIPTKVLRYVQRDGLLAGDIYWLPYADEESPAIKGPLSGFGLEEPSTLLMGHADVALVTSARVLELITGCLSVACIAASSVPNNVLASLPSICNFAFEVICIGNAEAQDIALKTLRAVIAFLPRITSKTDLDVVTVKDRSGSILDELMGEHNPTQKTPERVRAFSGPGQADESPNSLGSPVPVGSAANVAHARKAKLALQHVLCKLSGLNETLLSLNKNGPTKNIIDNYYERVWSLRMQVPCTSEIECGIPQWNARFQLNKKMLVGGVASILADALNRGVVDSKMVFTQGAPAQIEGGNNDVTPSKTFYLCALLCGGGLPSSSGIHRNVYISPSALFSQQHHKVSTPQVQHRRVALFPVRARIQDANVQNGVRLAATSACFRMFSEDVLSSVDQEEDENIKTGRMVHAPRQNLILPDCSSYESFTFSDVLEVEPLCTLVPVHRFHEGILDYRVPKVSELTAQLQLCFMHSSQLQSKRSKKTKHASQLKTLANSASESLVMPDISQQLPGSKTDSATRAGDLAERPIFEVMMYLRSLLLQLANMCSAESHTPSLQDDALNDALHSNLRNIVSIGKCSIVDIIASLVNSETGSKQRAQHSLLKAVLDEGDVIYLERIALEILDQSTEDKGNFGSQRIENGCIIANLNMTAMLGDVHIVQNKIRALTHFPSVKLQGPNLKPMSGRWFYECCLLSDGLMQIGWADEQFRCDPVCGQGVGDHIHSWAYDGLRTKKWNVSCETYGKRWRIGDIVGVLLDMDLMEMRYYLNGEDLGPSFCNFSAGYLFPAISLNVRQSLRVNFGQHKFSFPPDQVDGKSFHPIFESINIPKANRHSFGRGKSEDGESSESDPCDHGDDACEEDEDDDEAKEESDRSSWRHVMELAGHRMQEDATDGINSALLNRRDAPHIIELRRQALIENLIGMGFPVDWALRGAEHCETSTSESTVIAWIIERMEMEQSRLDDYDAEESSRLLEEEDEDGREVRDQEEYDQDEDAEQDMEHQHDNNDQEEQEEQDDQDDQDDQYQEQEQEHEEQQAQEHENEQQQQGQEQEGQELRQEQGQEVKQEHERDHSRVLEQEYDQEHKQEHDYGQEAQTDQEQKQEQDQVAAQERERVQEQGLENAADILVQHDETRSGIDLLQQRHALARAEEFESAVANATGTMMDSNADLIQRGQSLDEHGGILLEVETNATFLLRSAHASAGDISAEDSHRQLPMNTQHDTEFGLNDRMNGIDDGAWQAEAGYSQMLVGNTAQNRNTSEKDELVSLMDELLLPELTTIIASSQFCLCILYARSIIFQCCKIAQMQHLRHIENEPVLPSDVEPQGPTLQFPPLKLAGNMTHNSCSISETILSSLLLGTRSEDFFKFLQISFLRNLSSSMQSGKIFPLSKNSTPSHFLAFTPFAGLKSFQFEYTLSKLEGCMLERTASSLADENLATDTINEIKAFISLIVSNAHNAEESNSSSQHIEAESNLANTSKLFIEYAVGECLNIIDAAGSGMYDHWDWILNTRDEDGHKQDGNDKKSHGDYNSRPAVLFAYFLLRTLLTTRIHASLVVTPATFNRLLKGCSSTNISLKFCIFDLCSHLLFRVYQKLITSSASGSPDKFLIQEAAEYYVSAAKEKRIVQSFGTRFRTERLYRRLSSHYTRALCGFLLQWQVLRRLLGLFTDSHVREFIQLDWKGSRKTNDYIAVTHMTPTSICISWSVTDLYSVKPDEPTQEDSCRLRLFITVVSNMGLARPLHVVDVSAATGSHLIDCLSPDTLYKVFIRESIRSVYNINVERKDTESEVLAEVRNGADDVSPLPSTKSKSISDLRECAPTEEVYTYIATDAEPLFLIEKQYMSTNLELFKVSLTLRNTANKRWSTARASVKMMQGVHRWDVHIDRCVSKNIFLGVVGPAARLDNYVGCDRYGWAFLANKAIWHNKSKLGSYGELFRTGDRVSMVLDLEMGSLSFSLNGKDLGIAVEGLVGPLYPAFSLYNEDDQLTVIPQRSSPDKVTSSTDRGLTSSWSACANAGERVLDRVESLQYFEEYLFGNTRKSESRFASLQPTTRHEIFLRYGLWYKHGVGVRSATHSNGFISIVVSEAHCADIFVPPVGMLIPGHPVKLDGESAVVVGAASHRIWFQLYKSGEVLGFSKDSLHALCEAEGLILGSIASKMTLADITQHTLVSVENADNEISFSWDLETVAGTEACLLSQQKSWTLHDDETLVLWLELLAAEAKTHPINIAANHIIEGRNKFMRSAADKSAKEANTSSLKEVQAMLHSRSHQDILLRSLLMIHANDLASPILHLVSPDACEFVPNHPSTFFMQFRGLLFRATKAKFMCHIATPFSSTLPFEPLIEEIGDTSVALSAPNKASGEDNSEQECKDGNITELESDNFNGFADTHVLQRNDANAPQPVIFIVESEDSFAHDVLSEARRSGMDTDALLLGDSYWHLIVGIQSSFAGQLHAFLQKCSKESLDTNNIEKDDERWCSFLRSNCSSNLICPPKIFDRISATSQRMTPLIIRSKPTETSDLSITARSEKPTLLFVLLKINESADTDRMRVSDSTILDVFLTETFNQAERFFEHRLGWLDGQEDQKIFSAEEMTLVLQYFYALGTALGIGIRANVPCKMRLPTFFHALLSGDDDVSLISIDVTPRSPNDELHSLQARSLASALRRGLTSLVPTQCLDLMRQSDISFLLEGCPRMSCVSFLRRRASYEPGVGSADKHIAMFWAALSELSHAHLMKFLLHLWKSLSLSHSALTTELSVEDIVSCPTLRFFPPSALATLCSDFSSILVLPDRSGVSIPKYQNLAVMKDRLDDLVNSIEI